MAAFSIVRPAVGGFFPRRLVAVWHLDASGRLVCRWEDVLPPLPAS